MTAPIDRAHALLFDLKRPELAEQELRKVIAANPNDALAVTMLAHSLGRQGKLREAEQAIGDAIRLGPDLAYTHRIRGWLLDQRERLWEAEEAFWEALRCDPGDQFSYYLLGRVLYRLGDPHGAIEVADRGLARCANDPWCLIVRAQALGTLGRVEEAEAVIDAALRIDPSLADAHTSQGWLATLRGDATRAITSYRTALELSPTDTWTQEDMARVLFRNICLAVLALGTLAVVLLVIAIRWFNATTDDSPGRRLTLGAGIVFTVAAIVGCTRPTLQVAALRLTRWRHHAETVERSRLESFDWSCLTLLVALALVWILSGSSAYAGTGSLILAAVFVPILAFSLDLPHRERWKRMIVAGIVLLGGFLIANLAKRVDERAVIFWYLLCAGAALLIVCSDFVWREIGKVSSIWKSLNSRSPRN
jgi:Flp pilus assembly protein TadD